MKKQNITGNNIKYFREKMGIRQEDIAKYLGVKREVISYYENGSRDVPLEKLNAMADLFKVDLYDLMEENIDLQKANVVFAFRANTVSPDDMKVIAEFGRIVKNYIKLKELYDRNVH